MPSSTRNWLWVWTINKKSKDRFRVPYSCSWSESPCSLSWSIIFWTSTWAWQKVLSGFNDSSSFMVLSHLISGQIKFFRISSRPHVRSHSNHQIPQSNAIAEKKEAMIVKSIYHSPTQIRFSILCCFWCILFLDSPQYQKATLRKVASTIRKTHGAKNNMHHSTLQ